MPDNWADGYVADINYTSGFYGELLPQFLQFCLTLKGFEAPDCSRPLHYCELGCGHGVTANLMAMAYPDITFDAVDFNPGQIAGARAVAQAAGLDNIRFHERSFRDFLDEPGLPDYDIISLHGIYGWISPANREIVLRFIGKRLRPGGIVYISYNCAVGWSPLAPLRKLIQEQAESSTGGREEQIRQALALAKDMIASDARYFRQVPGTLDRIETMGRDALGYIAHEFLGREWHPYYFTDLARELWDVKLSFAASATLTEHVDPLNLSAEQQSLLDKITDTNRRESLRDFMVGQHFRRDIFVRGPRKLGVARRAQLLSAFRFALIIDPNAFVPELKVVNGMTQLPLQLYGPVVRRMANGPVRLADLMADPGCSGIGAPVLMQILIVLAGSGQASLCLPEQGYDVRQARAAAFNKALFEEPDMTGKLYFASPLLGGGVPTEWLTVTFLGAFERGIDPVDLAWGHLRDNNQRLVHEGRSLRTEAENREELARRLELFLGGERLRLEALGVSTVSN